MRLFGAAAERKGSGWHLAYGGAYYGIVDVAELGLRVVPEQIEQLTRAGAAITEALRRDHSPTHPDGRTSLGFVYGTIIVDSDPATSPDGRAGRHHPQRDRLRGRGGRPLPLRLGHLAPCWPPATPWAPPEVGDSIVNAGITGEAFSARVEGSDDAWASTRP